ncbi:hypothetical protein ADL29_27655 [Streptomyces chattanoogensis]|uniref:Uncharacterized protein n=1 Tax=Streptomyces chattanoogensis TaxID=66876 RepID=A0A0N0XSY7_9ACTN|nr:hypothetical protein ADL29_27655 [Streptomyces chattanoogensis]
MLFLVMIEVGVPSRAAEGAMVLSPSMEVTPQCTPCAPLFRISERLSTMPECGDEVVSTESTTSLAMSSLAVMEGRCR